MNVFANDHQLTMQKTQHKKYSHKITNNNNQLYCSLSQVANISQILADLIIRLSKGPVDLVVLQASQQSNILTPQQFTSSIDSARDKLKNPDFRYSITIQAHQIQPFIDIFSTSNKDIHHLKEVQFKDNSQFTEKIKILQNYTNYRIFINLKIFELQNMESGLEWAVSSINTLRIYRLDSNEIQQIPGQITDNFIYFSNFLSASPKQTEHLLNLMEQLKELEVVDAEPENEIEQINQLTIQHQQLTYEKEISTFQEKFNIEKINRQRIQRELDESRAKFIASEKAFKSLQEDNLALRNDLYNEREKIKYKLTKMKKLEEENQNLSSNKNLNGMEFQAIKDQQTTLIATLRSDNMESKRENCQLKQDVQNLKEQLVWQEQQYEQQHSTISELKQQLRQILEMK